jgi:hypothetical protein
MADTQISVLGIETATTVAGFIGAVVSLSVIRPLSRMQAFTAVLTGAITAAYGTPFLMVFVDLDQAVAQPVENGLAFFLGLVAMHLIPGIIELARLFRKNPRSFIPSFRGKDQ